MSSSVTAKEGTVPIPPISSYSDLQRARLNETPPLPSVLLGPCEVSLVGSDTEAAGDRDEIKSRFPLTYGQKVARIIPKNGDAQDRKIKVGVVLSGGQAAGGHNVITGICDYVKSVGGTVVGFIGGPHGLFTGNYVTLTEERLASFRNQGGFHMIGSGRHKIETDEQFASSLAVCEQLGLDGVVVIGGDDSNTNGAVLAEYFKKQGSSTVVCGCPKTIDGDLKAESIEVSFGFDTACKTFSELIGNIALDGLSSRKYHNFVRLMGRSASHITIECAFQTAPNLCLIGEEIEADGSTLEDITNEICDLIVERWKAGKDYSLTIVPEGLIEFVPEMRALISELNDILAEGEASGAQLPESAIAEKLSERSAKVFKFLPNSIRSQLLLERDPHGNVQVSRIETERLLMLLASTELNRRKEAGEYGGQFRALGHFYGYEGRSGLPSAFDSEYCYALGSAAGRLISANCTGYIASIRNLSLPTSDWEVGAVPLTSLMNMEKRKGKMKPVIKKALVEMDGRPMEIFRKIRPKWRLADAYRNPGPIQFVGDGAQARPFLLMYERGADVDPVHDPDHPSWNKEALAEEGGAKTPFYPIRDMTQVSAVQRERLNAGKPKAPAAALEASEIVNDSDDTSAAASAVRCMFPKIADDPVVQIVSSSSSSAGEKKAVNIGVVFMGRQCPGGHSVVEGLYNSISKNAASGSRLIGFLGGSRGFLNSRSIDVDEKLISFYANQGGYDMLGRTSDSLKRADFDKFKEVCASLKLDGLVLLGGAKTIPQALAFSEYLREQSSETSVVVVPATVSGDLTPEYVESTVGFDTACNVYSQLIGNIGADAASAKKYYYFIRLMGQQGSHVAVECALQTHPNVAILGEEVRSKRMSLDAVTNHLADVVCERAAQGKNFGVVLIPEGLVSLFPEVNALIAAMDASGAKTDEEAKEKLPGWLASLYASLPLAVRSQLLLARESDGSLELSHIDTEKLLIHTVECELKRRKAAGDYSGKFSALPSFFGYQARCALPSRFDCSLGFTLGAGAAALAIAGKTGYLANATGLAAPDPREWKATGVPLVRLVHVRRDASSVRLVAESPVDLHGAEVKAFRRARAAWVQQDLYSNPGPCQFKFDSLATARTHTLLARSIGPNHFQQSIATTAKSIIHLTEEEDNIPEEALIALDKGLKELASAFAKSIRDSRV